jgi:hypothetical protein
MALTLGTTSTEIAVEFQAKERPAGFKEELGPHSDFAAAKENMTEKRIELTICAVAIRRRI